MRLLNYINKDDFVVYISRVLLSVSLVSMFSLFIFGACPYESCKSKSDLAGDLFNLSLLIGWFFVIVFFGFTIEYRVLKDNVFLFLLLIFGLAFISTIVLIMYSYRMKCPPFFRLSIWGKQLI